MEYLDDGSEKELYKFIFLKIMIFFFVVVAETKY